VLVTLVKTKQDCLKKLLKTVRTTRWISELVRQRVPDHQTGDLKRPTAIMCWDDSEIQWAGDGLQNADEAEKWRRRTRWNGRRGTEVPDHEDSGTSWHPSCKWPSLAHPANEAHHGGVTSGHDQTSVCVLRRVLSVGLQKQFLTCSARKNLRHNGKKFYRKISVAIMYNTQMYIFSRPY